MNEKTRQLLNDLKAAGLDTSSLERQIAVNPLADKQADVHLGGGILRQAEYTRYMNELKTKEQQIAATANQLAGLHDAQNAGVQLPQDTVDAIKKMEEALIATGEFDEASVKSLSNKALSGIQNQIKPPVQPQIPPPNNNNNNNFPQNVDLSKYVDVNTLQSSLANIAYGSIATNMEINAAIDEVKALGIPVDRAVVRKFQENLRTGYDQGKGLDQIVEETFEVSKAKQAKQQLDIDNQIKTKVEEGIAEGLKAAGVPAVKKFNFGRRHPILDRKSVNPANIPPPNGDNKNPDGSIKEPVQDLNKLPTNKFGDVEVFRGRRGREERMQAASGVLEKVMEHYANDPTYVE